MPPIAEPGHERYRNTDQTMRPSPIKRDFPDFALIALSWPEEVPSEADALERMARYPFRAIHLRKPNWNKDRTEQLLQQLSPACRAKIRLHDHLELVKEYGLQGYHLNQRNRQSFLQIERDAETASWQGKAAGKLSNSPGVAGKSAIPCRISPPHSLSCHSLEEVTEHKSHCDYLFLSPVFDSISKQGYTRHFSEEELLEAREKGIIDRQVFALGGVEAGKLPLLQSYGFGGAALLGSLWKRYIQDSNLQGLERNIEKFMEISHNQ